MSSSGSHPHRFLTVDKSTVRAATNSHLQFSHTPKQAGLALQAADASCDWILWLTELCHRHPQNQGLCLKTAGLNSRSVSGPSNNEEKKKTHVWDSIYTGWDSAPLAAFLKHAIYFPIILAQEEFFQDLNFIAIFPGGLLINWDQTPCSQSEQSKQGMLWLFPNCLNCAVGGKKQGLFHHFIPTHPAFGQGTYFCLDPPF